MTECVCEGGEGKYNAIFVRKEKNRYPRSRYGIGVVCVCVRAYARENTKTDIIGTRVFSVRMTRV